MKTDLFWFCGHCWVFQICWHIERSTFTASSFRIWNSSTGIPSPPLALFIVRLSKAHFISHSRMSGSRWVITPSWLSGSWRSFLYSSSCHCFLISSVYAPTSNAEEAEVERFYEDLQDLLELTPQKDVLFILGDWNAKVGSQETPGVTGKFGLGIWNEARQRLVEFCQENALVIANTLFQQHKRRLHMDITRWSTPKSDGLYSLQPKMEKLYTVNKNKTRSWLWLRRWTPYYQIQT